MQEARRMHLRRISAIRGSSEYRDTALNQNFRHQTVGGDGPGVADPRGCGRHCLLFSAH